MAKDFEIINGGSLCGIVPMREEAQDWIDENVETEGWQWMGNVLYIDWRFAEDLIEGIHDAGFETNVELVA